MTSVQGRDNTVASSPAAAPSVGAVGKAILPALALAQFLASYANTSLNVSISAITKDLGTTVTAVQTSITLFTLVMATLMITGSKLTDIWGRKRTFLLGIGVFATGSAIASLAQGMGFLFVGYSLLQGIGSALLIPPIYILVTVSIDDLKARAAAFGLVGGLGGIGSAAGPLIGGMITTAISWRATFISQILLALVVVFLSRRIHDPGITGPKPSLDFVGVVLSALGMGAIVIGLLQASTYGWLRARKPFTIGKFTLVEQGGISPVWLFVLAGFFLLYYFYRHIRANERNGKEPLIHTRILQNRVANLGLVTQASQWFMLIGTSFVISVFLQVASEYSAIQTGLYLMPATVGLLIASARSGAMARRFPPRALLRAGFVGAIAGIILMLVLGDANASGWLLAPGLFLFGLAMGVVMTPSVNVVQSAMPEHDQGEISGVSRSVSNLGSSLGTAVAGAVLVSVLISGVTTLTQQSQTLPPQDKDKIAVALQGDVSAVSDTQVTAALQGQPQAVVDEVVSINAQARNTALAWALASIGLVGVVGLVAAMLFPLKALPVEEPGAEPDWS